MSERAWKAFDPGELPSFGAAAPGRGSVVAVLATPSARENDWAMRATVALADGLGGEGHDLIAVDADLDFPSLHVAMSAENAEGIVDLVDFGASPSRVIRDAPDNDFKFISAGTYAIDPGKVLGSELWKDFCEQRVAEAKTLLIYTATEAHGASAVLEIATDVVALATREEASDADGSLASILSGCEELVRGVYGPDTDGASTGATVASADAPEDGADARPTRPADGDDGTSVTPHPAAPSTGVSPPTSAGGDDDGGVPSSPELAVGAAGGGKRPLRWILGAGLAAVLVLAALWASGVVDPRASTEEGTAGGASSEAEGESQGEPGFGGTDAASDPTPAAAEDPEAREPSLDAGTLPLGPSPSFQGANELSGALSYAFQIAAYPSLPSAIEAARELEGTAGGLPALVVPVEIRGEPYYRLLAGPFTDSASAAPAIAASGLGAGGLHRRVNWSFHLGEAADDRLVRTRSDELAAMGIPTFLVRVEFTDGRIAHRIQAGAFTDTRDASYLAVMLAEVGLGDAPLARISGER